MTMGTIWAPNFGTGPIATPGFCPPCAAFTMPAGMAMGCPPPDCCWLPACCCATIACWLKTMGCCCDGIFPPFCGRCTGPDPGYICGYICGCCPPGALAAATMKPCGTICCGPPPGPGCIWPCGAPPWGIWCGPCCCHGPGIVPPAQDINAAGGTGLEALGCPSASWNDEPVASGQSGGECSGASPCALSKKLSRISPSVFCSKSGFAAYTWNWTVGPAGAFACGDIAVAFDGDAVGGPPAPLGENTAAEGLKENSLAFGLKVNALADSAPTSLLDRKPSMLP
mmetsp:Transcript_41591/g.114624  ORF Transcript_41591/g.114624 Transcript_41591/m.114624 type:complete len:283 (-) Transcript_41591:1514-2362(-)